MPTCVSSPLLGRLRRQADLASSRWESPQISAYSRTHSFFALLECDTRCAGPSVAFFFFFASKFDILSSLRDFTTKIYWQERLNPNVTIISPFSSLFSALRRRESWPLMSDRERKLLQWASKRCIGDLLISKGQGQPKQCGCPVPSKPSDGESGGQFYERSNFFGGVLEAHSARYRRTIVNEARRCKAENKYQCW